MISHVKPMPASFGYHQLLPRLDALVTPTYADHRCRLMCVARPPLPEPLAPEALPSFLATMGLMRVLWPPCPFDLSLVAWSSPLRHPRLVHRTVLALTVWLLSKVSCPGAGCSLGACGRFLPKRLGLYH